MEKEIKWGKDRGERREGPGRGREERGGRGGGGRRRRRGEGMEDRILKCSGTKK